MSLVRSNPIPPVAAGENWQEIVRQYVESLRFGTVEIIIHDSHVIQIEKTERVRLAKSGAAASSDPAKIELNPDLNPDNRSPRK